MQMTAVYACVRILSESIAGLSVHIYKYTDSDSKKRQSNILCRINNHICFFFVHKFNFLQNQIYHQCERLKKQEFNTITIAKSSFCVFTIYNTVVVIHIHAEFYCRIWFSFAQKTRSFHMARLLTKYVRYFCLYKGTYPRTF